MDDQGISGDGLNKSSLMVLTTECNLSERLQVCTSGFFHFMILGCVQCATSKHILYISVEDFRLTRRGGGQIPDPP